MGYYLGPGACIVFMGGGVTRVMGWHNSGSFLEKGVIQKCLSFQGSAAVMAIGYLCGKSGSCTPWRRLLGSLLMNTMEPSAVKAVRSLQMSAAIMVNVDHRGT